MSRGGYRSLANGASRSVALALFLLGGASGSPAERCAPEQPACSPPVAEQAPAPPAAAAADLVVYWGIGCPRCEEARPAVAALAARVPGIAVEWVEVRQSPPT